MHVSLGNEPARRSWGGGNRSVMRWQHLRARGVRVSFDLNAPDLDILILAEPRTELAISAYDDRAILRYLREVNRARWSSSHPTSATSAKARRRKRPADCGEPRRRSPVLSPLAARSFPGERPPDRPSSDLQRQRP
jgi:hypothetical protein